MADIAIIDERVPGRPGRTLNPAGMVEHHTASNAASGNAPSLNIVKFGRGGSKPVPGPLSNLLTGRDGALFITTDGSANHSGSGNSAALQRMRNHEPPFDLPPGSPNDHWHISDETIGNEIENNGIGEPYPDVQMNTVDRTAAALCDVFDIDPATQLIGHKEWTSRKIDPTFDMDAHRARVIALLSDPVPDPVEDDMPVIVIDPNNKVWLLGGTRRKRLSGAQRDEALVLYGQEKTLRISGDLLGRYMDEDDALTLDDVEAVISGLDFDGVDDDPDAIKDAIREMFADVFTAAGGALV